MRKLVAIALFLFASAVAAEDGPLNGHTLYWENDNFGIGRKSDRFYTNGVKATWLLTESPELARSFRRRFCKSRLCGGDQNFEGVNIILGHVFYTPERITVATPQPDDRPWAGWLYAGVSESIVDNKEKVLNHFELQAGILGPGAGGGSAQRFIHNDLHFSKKDPAGWPNQLKNEGTLGLMYRHARRYGNNTRDIIPEGAAMLGTVQTFASAGATTRVGWHMEGFPVGVIAVSANPRNPDVLPHKVEAYVFVAGEVRWVPINATLDGGFFASNPGKSAPGPERVVHDLRAGFSARIGWFRLTYTVVKRSKEFDVPAGHLAKQRFGSFVMTLEPMSEFRKRK